LYNYKIAKGNARRDRFADYFDIHYWHIAQYWKQMLESTERIFNDNAPARKMEIEIGFISRHFARRL
jgi:hypothetical protein